MKSLYESLLDDEEDLIHNTDAEYSLNVPDPKDARKITRMPPHCVGYMYEWKTPLFKTLIGNSNLDITGLYIYWTKYKGDKYDDVLSYYSVHVKPKIGKTFFHGDFPLFGVSSNSDNKYSAPQAKKLAYEFIKCISKHPAELLKIIFDANDHYLNNRSTTDYIYIEDLIDKYK